MIRGTESESNTFLALKRMVRMGILTRFTQSKPFDDDDNRGIDFRLTLKSISGLRIEIPLQVKSSQFGIDSHNQLDGQDIAVVNGQSDTLYEDLRRIIDKIRDAKRPQQKAVAKTRRKQRTSLKTQELTLNVATLWTSGYGMTYISRQLKVSRKTVWQHVNRSKELGLIKDEEES